jgi:anti-anti-sigma factor
MVETERSPTSPIRLRAVLEEHGRRVRVSFEGEMDCFSIPGLREKLKDFRNLNYSQVIFDLSRIEFLDTTVLSFLISNHNELDVRGGKLVCIKPQNPYVQKVLERTWVTSILHFADTLLEAESLFQSGD